MNVNHVKGDLFEMEIDKPVVLDKCHKEPLVLKPLKSRGHDQGKGEKSKTNKKKD